MTVQDRAEVVLASGNAGKLRELAATLAPLGLDLRAQSDWDVPEAVEDAPTFVENALIKARNAALHTGLPAIADDSGLVVPALDHAPGIHSARYAGESADDAANNAKLLQAMSGLEGAQRCAWFQCVMVYCRSWQDPVPLIASARWHGSITAQASGKHGFGYDPLFWVPDHDCTSAELAPVVKNRLSHRAQASQALLVMLEAAGGR